ncbi:MAG: TetR/AcrR family transcriptional regulator [Actinomycetota bacterium]
MSRTSQADWLAAAFELLSSGGIDALKVEPLAKHLGVTKGSFYHHFEDRRALHLAVLAAWENAGTEAIIVDVDRDQSEPAARLAALVDAAMVADPTADELESAIRAWAGADPEVAAAVERVDERRLAYVTDLLVDAGFSRAVARRRARLLYRAMIGAFFWQAAGGPHTTPTERRELVALLLAPG